MLTARGVKEFEDLILLRQAVQDPVSTYKEAFFLELGILTVGIIIKASRIIYFHYLVKTNESKMLKNVSFYEGDWTETVKQNLEE